jgi:phosphomannomutase
MALIKSISGIRGTIGGSPDNNISPVNIVELTSAFASFLNKFSKSKKVKVVVGRDARVSGEMINMIVVGT